MDRRWVLLSIAVVSLVLTTGWAQVLAGVDCGEPVPVPKYRPGEKWTWRDEKSREWSNEVIHVEGDITQIKWPGGSVAFHDKDWVVQQVRKSNGELVTTQGAGQYVEVGQKVLDFPLQIGKTWHFTYYDKPVGGSLQSYYRRHKILACEEVQTVAGRFAAFKIEVEQGHTGTNWSGTYLWWYTPQVKNRLKRQYIPSRYWYAPQDYELIKFETK